MSIGVANPRPSAPTSVTAIAVVMPITAPVASTSAPPDEPGEIGASVWIMSKRIPSLPGTWRPSALTTPTVTVGPPASPSGSPMAMASCPALRWVAVPSGAAAALTAVDLDDGDVGVGVGADELGGQLATVGQDDGEALRAPRRRARW